MTRTSHRRGALIATVAGVGLAAAACSPSGDTGDGAMPVLEVGIVPVLHAGAFFMAQELGYFEEEGIQVEPETVAGGAALIPALQSGSLDTGFGGLDNIIRANEQGLDIKCLSGVAHGNETVQIFASPASADEITSAADLEGRIVAVNALANINQLVGMAWIDSEGADAQSVQYLGVAYPDMLATLEAGRVDAAVLDEPFTTMAIEAGFPVLAGAPVEALAPTVNYSCWYVTQDWLDDNQEAAQAFVTAIDRAIEHIDADPDSLREILPEYTGLDAELAQSIVFPNLSSELDPAAIDVLQERAVEFGIIDRAVDSNDLIADLG